MQGRRWGETCGDIIREQREATTPKVKGFGRAHRNPGFAMTDFFFLVMAVKKKAAQDRLHYGMSQERVYPSKRLAKFQHDHLLPHILGMPSCMLEGRDAHISLQ